LEDSEPKSDENIDIFVGENYSTKKQKSIFKWIFEIAFLILPIF
jgi:hypothetical protein